MDVRGAEGVAVVQQRGVDQHVVLWIIHQILQVAQVTVAASDAVSSAVLVQDEHLTGTEPTLETKNTHERCSESGPQITVFPRLSFKSDLLDFYSAFKEKFFMLNNKQTTGNDEVQE